MKRRKQVNRALLRDHRLRNVLSDSIELDIVEGVPNTSPRRYRVAESDVVQELFELNSALNTAGE